MTREGAVPKRLVRDTRHGVIGGVAAGFGLYLDVDPVLVRLAFVLLAFANGLGILLYLIGWLLMPRLDSLEAGTGTSAPSSPAAASGAAVGAAVGSAAEASVGAIREAGGRFATEVRAVASSVRSAAPGSERVQAVVGAFLVVVGGVMLADNLGWLRWPWWADLGTLWPLILVALGIGLVARSRRPDEA